MVLQNRVVDKTHKTIPTFYTMCKILNRNTESNFGAVPQRKMRTEFGIEPYKVSEL